MSETSYPYKGQDGTCKFDPSKIKANFSGCWSIRGTEDQLKVYLHKYGPVSIG